MGHSAEKDVDRQFREAMAHPVGTVAVVEGRPAVLIGKNDGPRRWQWLNGDWTSIPLGEVEVFGRVTLPPVTGVELHCDDCQQPYGVWYADNGIWNLVMGGPEAKGDPGGMLCPRCFMVRAEEVFQQAAIWRLMLDNAERVLPPAMAEGGAGA